MMLQIAENAFGRLPDCRVLSAIHDCLSDAMIGDLAELAAHASEPNPFYEGWFLDAALRHVRGAAPVRLIEVRATGGQLIGLFPAIIAERYGRIRVRHVSNWQHFNCFLGSPLIRAGLEPMVWLAVLHELDRSPWAQGFLTISGMTGEGPVQQGLIAAAQQLGRDAPVVHTHDRAMLMSGLDPAAYLETHVRAKKRKELRRLSNRLRDMGTVRFEVLSDPSALSPWCDAFLALEAAGWKGSDGAALGNDSATATFFRTVTARAFALGKLDFQRLTLDGRPIAMLINFRTPPGSWSFKIAYDESLARFSPGVLIELENTHRVLNDPEIAWMDSCAVENHPMINSLWAERRTVVQMTVALRGVRRGLTYRLCRAAETTSARVRRLRKR